MFSSVGRNVLFITTKNVSYLRNRQEIGLLEQQSDKVEIIGFDFKSYPARLLAVYFSLLFKNMRVFDTVFIGFSPQLILPFWGWKFRKQNIIIDFFISTYDTFVFDRKKFTKNSLCGRLLKNLDCKTIRKADLVIADTNCHGQYFVKEFGLSEEKLRVLYLQADTDIYYPRKQIKPQRMEGKYVVLYFGSALPLQGVPVILEAIELMKHDKEIYFIMIGPIDGKFQKPFGKNIEYHEWLPQEELAEYISYSDLCLAGHFNAEIDKAKRTIPGKAYIYRAMDKPIILGDNPANKELYKNEDEGIYYVEMGSPKALVDRIIEIKESAW
ncbi:MAG: group 1 glycosyl transferase [Lachnospiraceae bacterium]|nr:group 1 glycosyl transferase [Lachnospiraceae bacterium]